MSAVFFILFVLFVPSIYGLFNRPTILSLIPSRCLHPPLLADAGAGGDAPHVAGAWPGPEAASGSSWGLEESEKVTVRTL